MPSLPYPMSDDSKKYFSVLDIWHLAITLDLPRHAPSPPSRSAAHRTSRRLSLSLHGVLARSCIRAAALTGRRPASGARVACAVRLQRRRGSAPADSGDPGEATAAAVARCVLARGPRARPTRGEF